MPKASLNPDFSSQVRADFERKLAENYRRVDRSFAWLLLFEWLAAIVVSLIYSPYAWDGNTYRIHIHVWLAVLCGGWIVSAPLFLVRIMPGTPVCRWTMATAQILFSTLFIHLTAGRIETHFHVFASMALLVAYFDAKVFIPAVAIVIADHLIRGFFWPRSVFGETEFNLIRPFEHAAWLLMETFGLCLLIREQLRQLYENSVLQAELKAERSLLETRVANRTKQLKSAQDFRETILNSIDSSICIVNSKGKIVFVNDRWSDMVQANFFDTQNCEVGAHYSSECSISKLVPEDFVGEVSRNISLVATGELDTYCTEHSFELSGSERHFRLSATPVVLENEIGVAIVYVDISHVKTAERRVSELARLILESPEMVLVANQKSGEILEANEGASSNTGYPRTELLQLGLKDLFPEFSSESFQSRLRDYDSNAKEPHFFESVVRRKNEEFYPSRVSLHQADFEDQRVWLLYVADLTEQKRLATKLNQSQKLESLGTLAAGIAHEINTPMQCVVGNLEFLHNSLERLLQTADYATRLIEHETIDWTRERAALEQLCNQSKYDFFRKQTPMALAESADSAGRIVSIVRAMKAFSHPGSSEASETDLHEIINHCVVICRNRWKPVATLDLNLSSEIPILQAYPAELSQVLVNLIVNATDAIGECGKSKKRELGKISIETKLRHNRVLIRVSDTGCGIPESIRKRIFDPFFTTKVVGKGTGQGLSITHCVIVEKHGGKIDVESEPGVGTTFRLELPIRATPKKQHANSLAFPATSIHSDYAPTVSIPQSVTLEL